MWFRSWLVGALLLVGDFGFAAEKALVKLTLTPEPGKPPVDVWLTRISDDDGGLTIKLVARGVGPKPQALTVYSGGGGDEGPGDGDAKSINARVFELPEGRKCVRVDFTYQVPETKLREIATDTWLIGFQGKTHKLLDELRTRLSRDRSKVCREREETELEPRVDEKEGAILVVSTSQKVDVVYGEDDLPVDKSCKAPADVVRKAYKLEGLELGAAATTPDPAKTPDGKKPEAKAPEAKTPDVKAPEAKTPDVKAPTPAKPPTPVAKPPVEED